MRDELVTTFWRNAYRSLPEPVRARYHGEFVTAERMELAIAGAVELWTRARDAVAGKVVFAR
jgi:hypothetical protein